MQGGVDLNIADQTQGFSSGLTDVLAVFSCSARSNCGINRARIKLSASQNKIKWRAFDR